MPITGEFNVLPSFSQNRLLFSSQELKSVEDIIHDAFSRDLDVLLCQDMNTLPTDFINSNTTYLCDDRILLQNLENNPSSGDCCTWSHHQTKCGECTGELSYIALTKGECNWDRASGDIYEYASNDGQKYDTYFCNVKASFDQASKICSSFGGRLFNEDVLLWGDTSSLISTRRSCSLLLENYSKAHGRLFQIPKEMGNNLSLITGYRAMSDLSGWCYWNGTFCLATQEEIPFGLHIEPTLINWAKEDDIDCSAPAISNALNSALSRFTKNITLKPVRNDMAIAFNYGSKLFEALLFDDLASQTDGFICERPEWNCQEAGCSHHCNDEGFCECPSDFYLEDLKNCRQQPVERVECFNNYMVALYKSESISSETVVAVNDPTCTNAVSHVGDMVRVEVPLDGCGTTLEYDAESRLLTFTNTLKAVVDKSKPVSIMSKIDKQFSCSYETVSTVDDGSVGLSSSSVSLNGAQAGSFEFKITTYSSREFSEVDAKAMNRVGETLYFAVEPVHVLSNLVYTVDQCEVLSESNLSYELFNINEQRADNYVKLRRYPTYFSDSNGPTCAVAFQDRWSYTVFQFYDLLNPTNQMLQTQFLKCTVLICKKEADMSAGLCASQVCQFLSTEIDRF